MAEEHPTSTKKNQIHSKPCRTVCSRPRTFDDGGLFVPEENPGCWYRFISRSQIYVAF